MGIKKGYNIDIDLQFRKLKKDIKFSQFDNNTSDFYIHITSDHKEIDATNSLAVIAVVKPSGEVATQWVEVQGNNTVYGNLKPSLKDEIGNYSASVMLINGYDRVTTDPSDPINYSVSEDMVFGALNEYAKNDSTYTLLTDMFSRLSNIEIQEYSRVTNENARINSELKREEDNSKRNREVEAKLLEVTNTINNVNEAIAAGTQDLEMKEARDGEKTLNLRLERDLAKGREIFEPVEGTYISVENTHDSYVEKLVIEGNTIQGNELSDIRSVGDKVDNQELFKIPLLSVNGRYNHTVNNLSDRVDFVFEEFIPSGVSILNKTDKPIRPVLLSDSGAWDSDATINANSTYVIPNSKKTKKISLYKSQNWDVTSKYDMANIMDIEGAYSDKLTILSPCQLEKGDVLKEVDGVWGVVKNKVRVYAKDYQIGYAGTTPGGLKGYNIKYYAGYTSIYEMSNKYKSGVLWDSTTEGFYVQPTDIVVLSTIQTLDEFKTYASDLYFIIKTTTPQFIPLPHSQQVKLRTFANKTNISSICDIAPTIKGDVSKSIGGVVNVHTQEIDNIHQELERVKKLEESTVSVVRNEGKDFVSVEATNGGYFEDVVVQGRTLINKMPKTNFAPPYGGNSQISDYPISLKTLSIEPNKKHTILLHGDISLLQNYIIVTNVDGKDTRYTLNPNGTVLFSYSTSLGDSPVSKIHVYGKNNTTEITSTYLSSIYVSILEGDHTQAPPSYFEGLASVGEGTDEIVVSTVNGGNIFDYEDGKRIEFTNYKIDVYHNIEYEHNLGNNHIYIVYYDKYNKEISRHLNSRFTTPFGCSRIGFSGCILNESDINHSKLKTFKVYLSNSSNKEVEHKADEKRLLRFNTETQAWEKPILREWDTVEKHSDGKYYNHERSGQVVLNGSENILLDTVTNGKATFKIPGYVNVLKAKLETSLTNKQIVSDGIFEQISCGADGNLYFRCNDSYASTVEAIKRQLQSNPVTVVYQLAQEKVYECTNIDLITYPSETMLTVKSGVLTANLVAKYHGSIANVVNLLQKKVSLLQNDFSEYKIKQDRLMLTSRYNADTVTFKVDYNSANTVNEKINELDYDLFDLIKDIVLVGKDNYNYDDMLIKIDFYQSVGFIDWDMWDAIWLIMELQHNPLVEAPFE